MLHIDAVQKLWIQCRQLSWFNPASQQRKLSQLKPGQQSRIATESFVVLSVLELEHVELFVLL